MNSQLKPANNILKRNSRTFSFAAWWLPRRLRQDVCRLYAWCRGCDDAVDHATSPEQALKQWRILRDDVDRIAANQASIDESSEWLEPLLRDGRVQRSDVLDLLEGMRLDLQTVNIQTDGELIRYSYLAAGVVGQMMCSVMRVEERSAKTYAKSLGIAMQLTNIARDVREDYERGRCYLPRIDDPSSASEEELASEIRRILAIAETHYQKAERGMRYLPWRCRVAIRIAAACYREIGVEILRSRRSVWAGRTVLSRWRFVKTAAIAAIPSFTSVPRSLSSSFNPNTLSGESIMSETNYNVLSNVYLGISLTAFMATGLFAMVYFNPKDASYSFLPLIYAGLSLATAIGTNIAARISESQGQ
jgi:phytoene synthase